MVELEKGDDGVDFGGGIGFGEGSGDVLVCRGGGGWWWCGC